jgi:phage tail-like protein
MMRRANPGLSTPVPLARLLPAVVQEDPFAVRLTAALDEVLAPAVAVLDCLEAYVDPLLAPGDFVEWLAEWVGAPLDDHWDDEVRRRSVLAAVSLHRRRGTLDGLVAAVALATGGDVDVVESGGTAWSTTPSDVGADAVADAVEGGLVVRVAVDDPDSVRLRALDELVGASKPAHLPHSIEVRSR